MELFDLHQLADARHRDALRSFRFAERAGPTRQEKVPSGGRRWLTRRDGGRYVSQEWSADFEG